MNNDKAKPQNGTKPQNDKTNPKPAKPAAAAPLAAAPAAPTPPVKVPPLFRKIDWLALVLAFVGVWIVYLYTLAPELTLEDSGELCTGSFYAGIPHPPGYPFWSIYSWAWTAVLGWVHLGNVAWRVEVGESFAAAMGCGLLAFMVSRGSSMLIEGIEEIKTISKQWENAICIVSGTVAGLLLGLGAFMWGESDVINRISLFGVPWLLAVILVLMRWSYAPQQRRYLYLAMLFFGWLATIHQSLLLCVPGVEILIALALPKLGRDLFVWNTLGYVIILGFKAASTIPAVDAMTSTEKAIFHIVGLGSWAAWNGIYLKSLIDLKKLKSIWLQWFWWALLITASIFVLLFVLILVLQPSPNANANSWMSVVFNFVSKASEIIMAVTAFAYGAFLLVLSIVTIWNAVEARIFGRELLTGFFMGIVWIVGVSVYLYEPISCMTDPPMQWGYPRTVEGFFHALSRGQYGSDEGTNLLQSPRQFLFQLYYLAEGLSESFTWAYLFVGLIPFAFLLKMHKRERNWILGLSSIYFFISVLLVIMLNVSADRSTSELNKVFFTASHAIFAMMIGYGVTIVAAYVATHYERIRSWCFAGAGFFLLAALYCLIYAIGKLYFGPAGQLRVSWLPNWYFFSFLGFGPNGQFGLSEIPHWIAQAFTKDQYGLPVFANLILVALPIIFLIALKLYRTRGPVAILLALFAVTPLCSGLSHWYKCEQRNHWFGYWFGHDMFTPPFLDNGELSYDNTRRAELMKDPKQASLIYPEMTRDTILFGGTDPGRFCPTYIIFCESFIPHDCQPKQDQKFDRRDVYIITQNALADGTYLDYLRAQYFRSHEQDPPFFSELSKYFFSIGVHSWRKGTGEALDRDPKYTTPDQSQRESEIDDNVASQWPFSWVNNTLYWLLDKPFTAWGKHVETYRRKEGVYPPKEIYIPSPQDSQDCFDSYYKDVQQRMQTGQLQPGEDVNVDPNSGKMQVSGQVAVMMINGLLCKVIFDHNPTNEFFVEESFPLPWMYPYETPFGIIMKINRDPLPQLTQDIFDRDHKFWSDYSSRLCGNWITYDTSVQQIADFVQQVYIQNNYKGFIGNRRFIRDEDGQKAFSKLRSSQAGMYAWRCSTACPPEYREQTPALEKALERETDFAFKQAFVFCPYSPEAVFRYVQFLMQYNRIDDALVVARTCLKLDPYNDSVAGLIQNLENFKKEAGMPDYQKMLSEAGYYLQNQQTNKAADILAQLNTRTDIPANDLQGIAQFFAMTRDFSRLETTLKTLTVVEPDMPEAWYDLARLEVLLGKKDDAMKDLKTSIELSDERLKTNSKVNDIRSVARTEPGFSSISNSPDFQKLVSP